jgi:hypothetical protein
MADRIYRIAISELIRAIRNKWCAMPRYAKADYAEASTPTSDLLGGLPPQNALLQQGLFFDWLDLLRTEAIIAALNTMHIL